jgi:hypothetical protein
MRDFVVLASAIPEALRNFSHERGRRRPEFRSRCATRAGGGGCGRPAGSVAEIKVGDTVVSSFNAAANAAAIKAATDALAAAKSGTDQAAIDAAQAALDTEKAVKTNFEKSQLSEAGLRTLKAQP